MKISRHPVLTPALAALVASFTLASCGKSVVSEYPVAGAGPESTPPRLPPSLVDNCGSAQMKSWDFVQPQPSVNRAVDLLFVMDSSASLDDERTQIAATIPAFVNALDPGTDYRMGVMLAHGGASRHSGRLYSASGTPKVLNSRIHSPSQVQSYLEKNLKNPVADQDEANGEMMLYSFSQSLSGERKTEIQSQGFYREGAALSVILISDENDVCYRPELNGYTAFPDFVPSYRNHEVIAYNRYCLGTDQKLKITPEYVHARAKALKTNEKFSVAAITHVDPNQVPRGGEDSIGHGLIQFVQRDLNGILMDIAGSYQEGLEKLGNVVSVQLKLDTTFALPPEDRLKIRPETVTVTVDGKVVKSQFDERSARATIQTSDAGQAGSRVQVMACMRQ